MGNIPISSRLDDSVENIEKRLELLSYRIRVAVPGIIQDFDPDTQLAKVRIAIRELLSFSGKPLENIDIPELAMVPIVMPRAGNFVLTMPVKKGDECLVVFADNCYDSWWDTGKVGNQVDLRRHDLSDGFAIPGIWSKPRRVENYSDNSASLRNLANDVFVEVTDTDVNITSSVDVNLTASTVNISGGSVNIDGTTTIESKSFMNHTHSGVQTGSGVSGGVA